jgi:hypothetical protein
VTSKRRPGAKPGRKAASRIDRRRAAIDRRREHQRRISNAEQRWRRQQRNRKIGLVALVVVVVGGVAAATLAVVRRGGGGSSAITLTSPLVSDQSTVISISAPPATYNLTYKIDTHGDEGQTTATEDVTIHRPFDGAVYSREGAPPGNAEQWHAISNFGLYSDTAANTGGTGSDQPGSTTQVQKAIPQTALGDFRLDATLDDLVTAGTFVRAEARQVLGRNCQVYRTGQPLESFGTAAPTNSDYTDACIDEAGLMLEEVSVQGGKLAERIIATQVTTQPTITDTTFAITGTPEPLASDGTELNPIDASAVPVPGYWILDAAPAGYQLQGRYVLRHAANPTTDETGTTTTTAAGQAPTIVDSYVDVYVNADKTIIVTQGPSTGEPSTQTTGGVTGDVGTLGSTTAVAGLTGSTLVAHPANPAGWYVHVAGSVPLATVQQVAQSLHA